MHGYVHGCIMGTIVATGRRPLTPSKPAGSVRALSPDAAAPSLYDELIRPLEETMMRSIWRVVRDGETGLLVVPRFPESLAEAVISLLENPGLAERLGEAGRKRVENRFSMDSVLTEIRTVYDRITAPTLRWMPA